MICLTLSKYVLFDSVSWPLILSKLPGGIHWVRLLLIFLVLLGIDSAFSLQEAVLTCVQDTTFFKATPKWILAGSLSLIYWLISLIYATDAGLIFLDTIDFYINFLLLLVGFFESFAMGWIYEIESQLTKFGPLVVFTWMFANFGAVGFASAIGFGVGNAWSGFVAFFSFLVVGIAVTIFLLEKQVSDKPLMTRFWDLAFGNILLFKKRAEPIIKTVPLVWCILIKQIIPHILLFLFINLATSKTKAGKSKFGHYEDYLMLPFNILGILTFVFTASLFLIGVISPEVYSKLDTYKPVEEEDKKPSFPVEAVEDIEA